MYMYMRSRAFEGWAICDSSVSSAALGNTLPNTPGILCTRQSNYGSNAAAHGTGLRLLILFSSAKLRRGALMNKGSVLARLGEMLA